VEAEVVLRTRALVKEHPSDPRPVRALQGVDLDVLRGQFLAVMGPSGSGKSTLLHLLGALDTPTEGEVWFEDQPLSGMSDDERSLLRRDHIGFVFQRFNLVPVLTARENVALPLVIARVPAAEQKRRVAQALEVVGVTARADHLPNALSGGEQQRVAIARALTTRPSVLLADEPTGNLDSSTGDAVMDVLRRARTELGQTLVLVTHDARIAASADEIVQLHDGRIVDRQPLRPDPADALAGMGSPFDDEG
jgi:putative ABC transport system ATP-binding protein